ncbi:MAG: hypothetical protein DRN35_04130 [Thermoplasmata archaeon]|nr:MAG: hypothetical protein DRN35_04130 [Thermoplasmata archaeon]RLF73277.1 MAG: hypothetical protein DRN55_04035 [Thermoplasmata archaeon]HDD60049.1 tetratricopeptide repeat protein [Euryarchaeota archaeon]
MAGKEEQLLQRAEVKLAEGDFKGAYRDFKTLSKKMPEDPRVFFGLAEAALGNPEVSAQEILLSYRRAVELDPENPLYLTSYGNYCLETGMLDRAEKLYRRAAGIDPDNAPQYYSDLATGIYVHGREFVGRIPGLTMDEILRRSIRIFLEALGITWVRAKELMEG